MTAVVLQAHRELLDRPGTSRSQGAFSQVFEFPPLHMAHVIRVRQPLMFAPNQIGSPFSQQGPVLYPPYFIDSFAQILGCVKFIIRYLLVSIGYRFPGRPDLGRPQIHRNTLDRRYLLLGKTFLISCQAGLITIIGNIKYLAPIRYYGHVVVMLAERGFIYSDMLRLHYSSARKPTPYSAFHDSINRSPIAATRQQEMPLSAS